MGDVPTSYTLAQFTPVLINMLGAVADTLNITASDDEVTEAVYGIIFEYGGIDSVSDATDISKLRTIGEYYIWKVAWEKVSTDYDFSDAGASYKRSQMFSMIERKLKEAERKARPYLSGMDIDVQELDIVVDPYEFHAPNTWINTR